MSWSDAVILVICLVACEGAGGIGALFTTPAIGGWYRRLKKPAFTPPDSVFGPVWILLYLLMALALFFVWRQGLENDTVRTGFIIFWVQLALNIAWSAVFFGRKSISGGMVVIALLWIAILLDIISFFQVSTLAGALMIPYLIWVTIAANLNLQIWRLNEGY